MRLKQAASNRAEPGPGSAIWRSCLACLARPKPGVVSKVDKSGATSGLDKNVHALVNQVLGRVEKKWTGPADGYRGLVDAINSDNPEHMKMVLGLPTNFP